MRRAYGFTIVELLIVIAVIAILAALSYVGYTNISQRANNATIINAASQSLKAIKAYIAETGEYPFAYSTAMHACITYDTGCTSVSGGAVGRRAAFDNSMATIGSLPRSVPAAGGIDGGTGVMAYYRSTLFLDGQSSPFTIMYYLQGQNQQCALGPVLNSGMTVYATDGYTSGNSNGRTYCIVSIPGPPHAG